ncbi:MAG: hypothetical protein GF416_01290 [Candidatus Altiarchaeales archaeon]|nr:hypothetical protein [Candidatus Altiarchaeales archaeon]MBD3415750.1 hypothetical protein [Candidatus Altiarchaeales archaeon]
MMAKRIQQLRPEDIKGVRTEVGEDGKLAIRVHLDPKAGVIPPGPEFAGLGPADRFEHLGADSLSAIHARTSPKDRSLHERQRAAEFLDLAGNEIRDTGDLSFITAGLIDQGCKTIEFVEGDMPQPAQKGGERRGKSADMPPEKGERAAPATSETPRPAANPEATTAPGPGTPTSDAPTSERQDRRDVDQQVRTSAEGQDATAERRAVPGGDPTATGDVNTAKTESPVAAPMAGEPGDFVRGPDAIRPDDIEEVKAEKTPTGVKLYVTLGEGCESMVPRPEPTSDRLEELGPASLESIRKKAHGFELQTQLEAQNFLNAAVDGTKNKSGEFTGDRNGMDQSYSLTFRVGNEFIEEPYEYTPNTGRGFRLGPHQKAHREVRLRAAARRKESALTDGELGSIVSEDELAMVGGMRSAGETSDGASPPRQDAGPSTAMDERMRERVMAETIPAGTSNDEIAAEIGSRLQGGGITSERFLEAVQTPPDENMRPDDPLYRAHAIYLQSLGAERVNGGEGGEGRMTGEEHARMVNDILHKMGHKPPEQGEGERQSIEQRIRSPVKPDVPPEQVAAEISDRMKAVGITPEEFEACTKPGEYPADDPRMIARAVYTRALGHERLESMGEPEHGKMFAQISGRMRGESGAGGERERLLDRLAHPIPAGATQEQIGAEISGRLRSLGLGAEQMLGYLELGPDEKTGKDDPRLIAGMVYQSALGADRLKSMEQEDHQRVVAHTLASLTGGAEQPVTESAEKAATTEKADM